ncbi:pro-resilin-like [Palaemon carinicauda]|uniref:pro-resilin-like n=1 Tax=Palaemon carinicauda TaxID=392227 RepID=UPI0035B61F21
MAFLKVTVLVALVASFAAARPQYEAPGPVIAPTGGGGGYGATGGGGGGGGGFGASGGGGGYGGGGSDGSDIPASYSFSYDNSDSDSGNYYGHAEQREGEQSEGEYRVLLPDGRTQIVKYKVDGNDGYRAQVSYEHPNGGGVPIANTGGGGGGGGSSYQ